MLLDLGNFRNKVEVNATSWNEKSTLLRVKPELNPELPGSNPELLNFKSGTS
jgi:hypothetical protein